jgi:quercetin dioxygenase-like cupin family protein
MLTANLLNELNYNDDAPAIKVLFKSPTTKEVRIAFKAGQKMKEHQTPYPISVEMVDGELDFGVEGTVHHLKKGDLLYLDGAIPHDLHAITDAIVRLTLSTQDTVQRVETVIAQS